MCLYHRYLSSNIEQLLEVFEGIDEHEYNKKKMIKKKVVIDQDITVKGIANVYKELI